MCIAVPMRVLEVRNDCDVVVTRPGRTEIANASFADKMPEVGDLVLVFRGTILRTVSQDEALKIESALCCVEEAMRTDEAESTDAAFADIIEKGGTDIAECRGVVSGTTRADRQRDTAVALMCG